MISKGIVAIVGRPNVGKSTLFNRLVGSRRAIVDDIPGVTRDRLYGTVKYYEDGEQQFMLVDTGGFEDAKTKYQPFASNLVWEQTEIAIAEADLVVMLLDAKCGLQPHDEQLVRYLQRLGKQVIYVVNKIDSMEQKSAALEFYSLGIDEFLTVSAAHNRGVGDLVEAIALQLAAMGKKNSRASAEEGATHVALVGRPNVGKSSILNRMLGEDRSLVSEVAGTTRDTVDTPFRYNKLPYVILDTAGMRRKSRIDQRLESLSVLMSLKAIERADIVVVVIDAVEGLTDQDARLASLASEQYKPVLMVVNKWDLITHKTTSTAREYELAIRHKIKSMAYIPILFTSCLENQRVSRIMSFVETLAANYRKRVKTSQLNEFLAQVVKEHTPALVRSRSKLVKFYYATQVKVAPPTFVVMCNLADEIHESYKRYIRNRFREGLGFTDVPLQIIFRPKPKRNPDTAHH